jgi:hypothetical protein
MKPLAIVTLVIAGAALAACGTSSRENRFNETAYADHNGPERKYDHDVVYRSYGYDDPDVVYVQPAYRVVPTTDERVIYYYD